MKLSKWAALTLIASSVLFASLSQAGEKLTIGASPVPHSEILEFIKPIVAKQGVDLDKEAARTLFYGMPYDQWKAQHQTEAGADQTAKFAEAITAHTP